MSLDPRAVATEGLSAPLETLSIASQGFLADGVVDPQPEPEPEPYVFRGNWFYKNMHRLRRRAVPLLDALLNPQPKPKAEPQLTAAPAVTLLAPEPVLRRAKVHEGALAHVLQASAEGVLRSSSVPAIQLQHHLAMQLPGVYREGKVAPVAVRLDHTRQAIQAVVMAELLEDDEDDDFY